MSKKGNGHKGHFWMMLVCFVVMVGGVYFIGRGGLGSWNILFFLLCPLMHFVMMRGMGHGTHKEDDEENHDHH